MAVYNLLDLIGHITEIINDGYIYAEIFELSSDDDSFGALSFSALTENEFEAIDYEEVDALPSDYDFSQKIAITEDTPCYTISASEAATMLHALDNALEYFKECSANKDGLYSRDILEQISHSSVRYRNLQAKFRKFLNNFK